VKVLFFRNALTALAVALAVTMGTAQADEGSDSKGSDSKSKEIKAAVVGIVEVKTESNRGKEAKAVYVKVQAAKDSEGNAIAKTDGTRLKVVGSKSSDVAKYAGKEVSIAGKIREGKELHVDAVALKAEGSGEKTPAKGKKSSTKEGSDSKEGSGSK